MKKLTLLVLVLLVLVGCGPSEADAETDISTAVAQTVEFDKAIAQAVSTGIAATMTAFPTETPTDTPEPTSTSTSTATLTPTLSPTNTATNTAEPTLPPTKTLPPEPTETTTPTAAELKVARLYTALRNLKYYAEKMYEGLPGNETGLFSCSRELSDSIVTNYERVSSLEVFDDTYFSQRVIGANISYNSGRKKILEDANIIAVYNHCVAWIEAGKPSGTTYQGDYAAGRTAADQAAKLAEAGLNN